MFHQLIRSKMTNYVSFSKQHIYAVAICIGLLIFFSFIYILFARESLVCFCYISQHSAFPETVFVHLYIHVILFQYICSNIPCLQIYLCHIVAEMLRFQEVQWFIQPQWEMTWRNMATNGTVKILKIQTPKNYCNYPSIRIMLCYHRVMRPKMQAEWQTV